MATAAEMSPLQGRQVLSRSQESVDHYSVNSWDEPNEKGYVSMGHSHKYSIVIFNVSK